VVTKCLFVFYYILVSIVRTYARYLLQNVFAYLFDNIDGGFG